MNGPEHGDCWCPDCGPKRVPPERCPRCAGTARGIPHIQLGPRACQDKWHTDKPPERCPICGSTDTPICLEHHPPKQPVWCEDKWHEGRRGDGESGDA
jgi:hypothetical protein